jgi:hypothetical protein
LRLPWSPKGIEKSLEAIVDIARFYYFPRPAWPQEQNVDSTPQGKLFGNQGHKAILLERLSAGQMLNHGALRYFAKCKVTRWRKRHIPQTWSNLP